MDCAYVYNPNRPLFSVLITPYGVITMFTLLYSVCVHGFICLSGTSPIAYDSLDRCFQQGAILSGIEKAALDVSGRNKFSYSLTCEAMGEKEVREF